MTAPSVFIIRLIPDSGIARLVAVRFSVEMNPRARALFPHELRAAVGRHDAVICQLADRIDEQILSAAAPRCRVFATCAVGYDNIDLAAARRLGIIVTNTPEVLTEATADLAWALLLAAARRLGEAERYLRAGAWAGWGMLDFLGMDVWGRTLGIVGAGRIGTAVARRGTGFGMRILYHDSAPRPPVDSLGAQRVPLAELLEASDFVSLHTPLVPETRNLIDAQAIARMKRGAILINTARGAVVDQDALIEALRLGRIAGAGLDVYRDEPRIPRELLELPNVVLAPHIGSATIGTRARMAELAAENVIAVLRGERPPTAVTG
jgi:glyoxylate reductase